MNKYNGKSFMELLKRIVMKTQEYSRHGSKATPAGNLGASEVSLIVLIGQHENIKVTDLAKRYGATKGAVSTMVKNLARKNLVKKYRTPENEKEVLLSLTDLGTIIFAETEVHFQNLYDTIDGHLRNLSYEQAGALFKVLQAVEAHIEEHVHEK